MRTARAIFTSFFVPDMALAHDLVDAVRNLTTATSQDRQATQRLNALDQQQPALAEGQKDGKTQSVLK